MNYTAEQINTAFSKLSETTSRAISRLNIKEKELEIITKYKIQPEIAVMLSNYIIFALIGLFEKKIFELRIIEDLNLSKEDSENVIKDINRIIFEEFKKNILELEEKEKILRDFETKTSNLVIETKPINLPVLDSRFSGLPKQVQTAISRSNWRETLYSLAPKYKLTIEQMGILEEITVKVMLNTIHSNNYENELASKITIPKEDIVNLIKEVDENIFKKIRSFEEREENSINNDELIIKNEESASMQDGLKINNVNSEKIAINQEEEIPLPPYGTSSKEQVVSSMPKVESNIMDDSSKNYIVSSRKEEGSMQKVAGSKEEEIFNTNTSQNNVQDILKKIETIKIPVKPIEPVSQTIPQNPQAEKTPSFQQQTTPTNPQPSSFPKSIIEEKLMNPTVSENTTTDYSTPKKTDPYREAF